MNIHLFNPENDYALADFSARYTPPKNVKALGAAGCMLPCWFSEHNDFVLVGEEYLNLLSNIKSIFPSWLDTIEALNVPFNLTDLASDPELTPRPWGWSPASARRFVSAGMNEDMLPSENAMNVMRELSHRRTSIRINGMLGMAGISVPEPAVEIDSLEAFGKSTFAGRDVFLKSPWSSSGRGVFDSSGMSAESIRQIISGTISRQGAIVVEPRLAKVADFAMLFTANHGDVEFVGYSLFSSTQNGTYVGNILADEDSLLNRICSMGVARSQLTDLSTALCGVMREVIGRDYNGEFGIDMMVYKDMDGRNRIAPCVELNLRTTMGFVALKLTERYLHEDSLGTFSIVRHRQPGELRKAVVLNGRLICGDVSMALPNSDFLFIFSAEQRKCSKFHV